MIVRWLFFTFIIRPFITIILGLNVRRIENLPEKGPAVIVANHNSHLDTLVLMTLFQGRKIHQIRPIAAVDYFLKNKFIAWFALNIIHIIPLDRKPKRRERLFKGVYEALDQNHIVILFPEGSRGEPEQVAKLKSGIFYLLKERPDVPIYPVFMHGLGKSLPKGERVFVPFFCDVFIGEPFKWKSNKREFMNNLEEKMNGLAAEGSFPKWD
ncbi:lysophospholipid acyltransferase family protein [Pseudogracilibacillus sp. SE30717A]|uniref:lysophospholipid acyltransferase family protein n=1 Tax=Pseudogracilibacillus sp. SE30717A TaxID=3098293 RepID=UPI00300E431D